MTDPVRPVGWMGAEHDRDDDRWERLPLAQRIVALVSVLRAQDTADWHAAAVKQVEKELAAAPVPCAASPADPWQPIEAAPKDGTQVWAWDDGRGSNPALFASDADAWLITYDDAVIQPTHWMPLPTPPRATGEGARDAVVQLPDVRRTLERGEVSELRVEGTATEVTAPYDISTGRVVTCSCVMVTGGNRALNTTCPIHGKPETAPVAVSLDPHRLRQEAMGEKCHTCGETFQAHSRADHAFLQIGDVGVQRVVDVQRETLVLEWARANGLSLDQLAELCARLRGEATVRVDEDQVDA